MGIAEGPGGGGDREEDKGRLDTPKVELLFEPIISGSRDVAPGAPCV
jgi:hypothetical protein